LLIFLVVTSKHMCVLCQHYEKSCVLSVVNWTAC